jgi:hypothetical protein
MPTTKSPAAILASVQAQQKAIRKSQQQQERNRKRLKALETAYARASDYWWGPWTSRQVAQRIAALRKELKRYGLLPRLKKLTGGTAAADFALRVLQARSVAAMDKQLRQMATLSKPQQFAHDIHAWFRNAESTILDPPTVRDRFGITLLVDHGPAGVTVPDWSHLPAPPDPKKDPIGAVRHACQHERFWLDQLSNQPAGAIDWQADIDSLWSLWDRCFPGHPMGQRPTVCNYREALDAVRDVERVLAQRIEAAAAPATGPITVSQQEAAVLKGLLSGHPARMTALDLADLLRHDEKSIRTHLKNLRVLELVTQASKTGCALTAAGLKLTRELPEGAGAAYFGPPR